MLRIWFRSRSAVFWALAFPLLMMLIFGAILGDSGGDVSVTVQDRDGSEASGGLVDAMLAAGLKLNNLSAGIDALGYARDHNVHTLLLIPDDFSARLAGGQAVVTLYQDKSQTNSNIAGSVIRGIVDRMNLQIAGSRGGVTLRSEPLISGSLGFIDFFMPGVIGMTITTTALIGTLEVNTKYKVRGILKKITTTPITKLEWVVSKVLYQSILGLITGGVIVAVGIAVFDIRVRLEPLAIPILFAGSAAFAGMSMAIARFVREEETANAAGSAIALPMFFLGGTFFAIESMPPYLQAVAKAMPLTYVNEALRAAMITGNEAALAFNGAVVAALALGFVLVGAAMTEWKEV